MTKIKPVRRCFTITPEQADWVENQATMQYSSASSIIRAILAREMERQEATQHPQPAKNRE